MGSAAKAGSLPGTFPAPESSESVSLRALRGNFGRRSKNLPPSEKSECQGRCTSRYAREVWEVWCPTASWVLPPSVSIVPEFRGAGSALRPNQDTTGWFASRPCWAWLKSRNQSNQGTASCSPTRCRARACPTFTLPAHARGQRVRWKSQVARSMERSANRAR